MLIWVGIAVALATYPIVRKLTRRLERLQDGVQQWGQGDLSIRVPEAGQDEVAFLAKRFNAAAQRVQTLVQSHEALLASQKSLLANASHELRSPLTRIRMGLELMGTSATPAFRDEISRNISELDQLIEEILLASRLDAREADMGTIEPVDLIGMAAEEAARVDAELDVQAPAVSDTHLGMGTELVVHGVTKLLRRALRNLLENARRYGAGSITVSLQQKTQLALIRVCDRGPGVPLELQERIFEPFYRLPGATERDGGVGLGLALVKSIAQRHGGRAYCEANAGGGACFVIELPLGPKSSV
jgi:signal transduction histidine kinase